MLKSLFLVTLFSTVLFAAKYKNIECVSKQNKHSFKIEYLENVNPQLGNPDAVRITFFTGEDDQLVRWFEKLKSDTNTAKLDGKNKKLTTLVSLAEAGTAFRQHDKTPLITEIAKVGAIYDVSDSSSEFIGQKQSVSLFFNSSEITERKFENGRLKDTLYYGMRILEFQNTAEALFEEKECKTL